MHIAKMDPETVTHALWWKAATTLNLAAEWQE